MAKIWKGRPEMWQPCIFHIGCLSPPQDVVIGNRILQSITSDDHGDGADDDDALQFEHAECLFEKRRNSSNQTLVFMVTTLRMIVTDDNDFAAVVAADNDVRADQR